MRVYEFKKTHIFDVTDKKNPPAPIDTKKRKDLIRQPKRE